MRQRNITELSGGWKMKLALARAMLLNADILLLDGVCGGEKYIWTHSSRCCLQGGMGGRQG